MPLQQRQAKIETFVDSRKRRRHKLLLEIEARGPESLAGKVVVHDISDTGLLIETECKLKAGEMIEVNLPQAGLMEAEIMWEGGEIYGCRFTHELPPAAISAARLGGGFTRPNAGNALKRNVTPLLQNSGQATMAMAGELSPGARLWIIIGLASSLWVMVGATTYWIVA